MPTSYLLLAKLLEKQQKNTPSTGDWKILQLLKYLETVLWIDSPQKDLMFGAEFCESCIIFIL